MPTNLPALLGGPPINPAGPPPWPPNDPAVQEALAAVIADGSWGRYHGPHSEKLKAALAEYHDAKHVHLCASGTAAVELALRGLGVEPGNEVILAAYDFEANIKNVLALGAMPVLVDIRPDDAQIDLDQLEAAASPKVKTVLISHLHGGIVDMPRLRRIADERGWSILEDACQSPGAMIDGRRAGTWGDAGTLSFGGSKLLSAGRGGCVITNRDDVLQRIKLHTWRGNDLSPLSEIQAALLLPQLKRLDDRNTLRAKNAQHLAELLENVEGLAPFSPPPTSHIPHPNSAAYYKFPLWYDPDAFAGLHRNVFAAAIRAEGFSLWPSFRSLHRTHSKRRFRAAPHLPHADRADNQLLVLHHPILLEPIMHLDLYIGAVNKIRHFAHLLRDEAPPSAYDSFPKPT